MITNDPLQPPTHLRAVGKVSELRLPQDEVIRRLVRVAELEAQDAKFGKRRVRHVERSLIRKR